MNDESRCRELAAVLQRTTKRRGAIPISLPNSQFHSSLGTLPPLPVAAQHANQVNALCLRLLPHAGNTVSITRASQLLRETTAWHSSTSFCGKCKRDFTSTPTVAIHTGCCTQIFLYVSFLTSAAHSECSARKMFCLDLW